MQAAEKRYSGIFVFVWTVIGRTKKETRNATQWRIDQTISNCFLFVFVPTSAAASSCWNRNPTDHSKVNNGKKFVVSKFSVGHSLNDFGEDIPCFSRNAYYNFCLAGMFFSSTNAPWTNWIKLSRPVLKRPLIESVFEKRASLAWSILRSLELCSERSLLCASVKILAAKESFGHLLNETKTGNDSSARFTSTLYLGERLWLVCGLSCKSENLAVTCIILTWAQVYVARIIL